jgi:hypothetical protein
MDTMGLSSTGTPYFSIVIVPSKQEGFDLLTAEKGRLCLFLGKDCCFFTNKSGIVRNGIGKLRDRAQQLISSQPTNILSSLWLIPLAIPLILSGSNIPTMPH